MLRTLLVFALMFLLPSEQDRILFEGYPAAIGYWEEGLGTANVNDHGLGLVDGDGARDAVVRIVERDGVVYWASRDNRVLNVSVSGSYIYYQSQSGGGGYVKVLNPDIAGTMRTSAEEAGVDRPFDYQEVLVGSGLSTISYWGYASINEVPE
jgi:hypothetical protein